MKCNITFKGGPKFKTKNMFAETGAIFKERQRKDLKRQSVLNLPLTHYINIFSIYYLLKYLMGLYFLDDTNNNIPNHQKIKAYEQT